MYTRCPKCETVYELDEPQLNARGGLVRCGHCTFVFNATWNLVDVPTPPRGPMDHPVSEGTDTPAAAHPPDEGEQETTSPPAPAWTLVDSPIEPPAPDSTEQAAPPPAPAGGGRETGPAADEREWEWTWDLPRDGEHRPAAKPDPSPTSQPQPLPDTDYRDYLRHPPDEEIVLDSSTAATETTAGNRNLLGVEYEDEQKPTPAKVKQRTKQAGKAPPLLVTPRAGPGQRQRRARRRRRVPGWLTGLAAVVLLLALTVQGLHFYFHELSRFQPVRPALEWLCARAGCRVPPRADIERIELVDTEIARAPGRAGVLRLALELVNRARFAQPYPTIEVTLTNHRGQTVARRSFAPHQYLAHDKRAASLPVNVAVELKLFITNPNNEAVGYEVRTVAPPAPPAPSPVQIIGGILGGEAAIAWLEQTSRRLRNAAGGK